MKKTKTLIGLVATVAVIVAIFTLFADAFGGVRDYPSSRGSAYQIMFGHQGYDAVPGLIAAFVLLCVGALVLLIGSFFPSKIGAIILGIGAITALVGSVLLFFGPSMFLAVANNGAALTEENPTLGVGLILPAIFGILGSLFGFFGARAGLRD